MYQLQQLALLGKHIVHRLEYLMELKNLELFLFLHLSGSNGIFELLSGFI